MSQTVDTRTTASSDSEGKSPEQRIREAKSKYGCVPVELRNEIAVEFLGLVHSIVNRISARLPPQVDLDDLFDVGVIGLLDAIENYEGSGAASLKTYAYYRIHGCILDELRNLDWVPRRVRQQQRTLEQVYASVQQQLGRKAQPDEIASAMGIGMDELHDLLTEARSIDLVRIESMVTPDEDMPREQVQLRDARSPNPHQLMEAEQEAKYLRCCLEKLNPKQRLVIDSYYFQGANMHDTGQALGITESRVCQIHKKAISCLRAIIRKKNSQNRRKHA